VRSALALALCFPALASAGAPTRLHLRATYVDGRGAQHRLELWRDGDRLRRDTDD
jgi:hypothetical protein